MTNLLAIYGAVVATVSIVLAIGSLVWQVYSWWHDRRTNVKVRLSYAFLKFASQLEDVVMITVLNHSHHPVRINSVGLEVQDSSGRWAVSQMIPSGASIPGTIAPRASAETWWLLDEVRQAGFDLYKPLVARANASTGDRFRSKRTTLRTR